MIKKRYFLLLILISPFLYACDQPVDTFKADVIIYGGKSAAVIAAVEVAQSGNSVIVVSAAKHLGGLPSGGLGFTDSGNTGASGGLARQCYHRVWLHYNDPSAW